jgi:hypothetical protein
MPALGNHECEFGTDNIHGHPGQAPGGIAAQGAAGNYWNGPYGFGHYLSRFLLPDNGVTNWDGNRLRGNFYAFQVGTVKFISLDADDVIYQDGASAYLNSAPNAAPETTSSGASIPNGTVTTTATPAIWSSGRRTTRWCRTTRAAHRTCRRCGSRRRWRRPGTTPRST